MLCHSQLWENLSLTCTPSSSRYGSPQNKSAWNTLACGGYGWGSSLDGGRVGSVLTRKQRRMENFPTRTVSTVQHGTGGTEFFFPFRSPEGKRGILCRGIWNLLARFKCGDTLRSLFQQAVNCFTTQEKSQHMQAIANLQPAAAEYLNAIEPSILFRASADRPKFGVLTNMAETMNGVFAKARGTTRLNLLKKIEHWVVEHMAKGKIDSQALLDAPRELCEYASNQIGSSVPYLASYKYSPTNVDQVYVVYTDHLNQWQINLANKTCTCKRYDELQLPCVHALKVITAERLRLQDHCSTIFHATSLALAYSSPFMPAVLTGLQAEANRQPPSYRNLAGRPRKRRISSAGEQNANNKFRGKCSRCGQTGHYTRTCRNAAPANVPLIVPAGPDWLARAAVLAGDYVSIQI